MDSTSTLAAAKTDVFGKDPTLGTDGEPLERGVGSPWNRAAHIAKAHYHAADAWAACDGLVSAAKALLVSAERVSAAAKAAVEAANAAKGEVPVVESPTAALPVARQAAADFNKVERGFRHLTSEEAAILEKALRTSAVPAVTGTALPPDPVNLSFDIPKS